MLAGVPAAAAAAAAVEAGELWGEADSDKETWGIPAEEEDGKDEEEAEEAEDGEDCRHSQTFTLPFAAHVTITARESGSPGASQRMMQSTDAECALTQCSSRLA